MTIVCLPINGMYDHWNRGQPHAGHCPPSGLLIQCSDGIPVQHHPTACTQPVYDQSWDRNWCQTLPHQSVQYSSCRRKSFSRNRRMTRMVAINIKFWWWWAADSVVTGQWIVCIATFLMVILRSSFWSVSCGDPLSDGMGDDIARRDGIA